MHFSTAIFGAFVAAAGLAVALPQPEVNIHTSISDPVAPAAEEVVPLTASESAISHVGDLFTKLKATSHGMQIFSGGDKVIHVRSNSEYDTLIATPDRLVVVDFTAMWCGPCRSILPLFASYSNDYRQALFLSVDIDMLSTLPDARTIRSVPTFRFFKNKRLLTEITGTNHDLLKSTIEANL